MHLVFRGTYMHLRWVRWMNERSSYFCPSIGQIVQPDSSPLELDDRWMCPPRQVIIQYAAILHLLLSQMQSFILSLLLKFSNTNRVLSSFSRGGNMWNMRGRTLWQELFTLPNQFLPVQCPRPLFPFHSDFATVSRQINKQAAHD